MRYCTLFVLVQLVLGCGADRWHGYVYPDRNDLSNHVSLGVYESLSACRQAGLSKLVELNSQSTGDFECGKNCDGSVCEETLRY